MGERGRIRLSPIQVVAGALAALSAAVAASFLGVYGTIIGAAMMSVITTVGSTLYEHSMNRSKARLRDAREARLTRVPAGVAVRAEKGAGVDAASARSGAWRRAPLARPAWWKAVGAVSLLVFAIAMGALTVMEDLVGKPAYDIVQAGDAEGGAGTTFRHVLGEGGGASGSGGPEQDGSGDNGPGQGGPGQDGGPMLPADRTTGPDVRDFAPGHDDPDAVTPSPGPTAGDDTNGVPRQEEEPRVPAPSQEEATAEPEYESPVPEPGREEPVRPQPFDGGPPPAEPAPSE